MTPALSETVPDTDPRIDILTPDQWRALQAFAGTLTASQAIWTSGYLLALSRVGASPASAGLALLDAPQDDAPQSGRRLTILYGSETGNSAALARTLATRAAALGPAPTLVDMADYAPRRLKDEQDLLVITSTYGDGDPPQPAVAFFEFVDGRKAPSLVSLRYAVLALGDSSYEHFCESGRTLDLRLEVLGARRLLPRVDCDVDFETPATMWMDAVLDTLASSNPAPAVRTASAATVVASAPRSASPVIDRRNPLMAIEAIAAEYGLLALNQRSAVRLNSMACVALPTCGLAMAESERYLPSLIGRIEALLVRNGLGDQPITIRMSGCPNGCSRPYIAEVGLTGRAPGKYNLYLGGGAYGQRLNRMYRENVGEPAILAALDDVFTRYAIERLAGEPLGDFAIRAGYVTEVIEGRFFND